MTKEPFMLVSLKEDKAKKLSNVLSNKTATKILEYLSGKDATESQIAKALKIPLSTVNYNMKQLVSAKLVVADEFHYSEKGKEVNHYKLANKYIIIAPAEEDTSFLTHLKKFLPAGIILAGTAVILKLFGFTSSPSRVLPDNVATKSDGMQMVAEEAAPEMLRAVATDTAGIAADETALAVAQIPAWQLDVNSALIGAALMLVVIILLTYVWKRR